jgi:tetratricopeptide (TPR) repeat protein
MTPEEAIHIADEAVKIYSGRSLTDIQRLILQESFSGKGYEEMIGYEHQHIKNEGSAFWKLLSEALEEKVSKTSFKGALEKRLKSSQIVLSPPHPNIYDSEKWVGRSPLIEKLLNKFQENTRIVWLTGLSGIGKTTLGECIAVKAWENNPSFQWIHLEISVSQLTDFATGAREILSQLGEKDLDPQEMNDPKRLSDRLLQKLQSSFYWLQIDALEKLISVNEFIDSYWLTFFENCLNINHFLSRLLLISQVLPNSLINWCDRFSNIWHQEALKGLENEESEQYFAKNGIIIDEFNQDILTGISQTYEGHPLVLQVITGEILQVYQGNVTTYWKVNQAEFEQVSRELKSSRLTETNYNEQLARRVRERVRKSLEQLPEKAIALLCRSAVYRRPVPKSFWLGLINEYSSKEQNEAYRVLGDRALIEKEKNLIRLHNLVRDIAYDWLQEDEVIWKSTEIKAAELWLSEYQHEENAQNLEKVRGYLEAFYHYCDAEDWVNAGYIFTIRPEITQKQQLHNQLFTWGYYDENIYLCNKILKKVSNQIDIVCYKHLAENYHLLGEYNKATEYCNKGLTISRKVEDVNGQSHFYDIIGNIYRQLGRYQEAIKILNKALQNSNKLELQSTIYNNLGTVYSDLKEEHTSFYCFQFALSLAQKINYFNGIANSSVNIAGYYGSIGKIKYAKQYLEIAEFYGEQGENDLLITNLKEKSGLVLCSQEKDSEGLLLLEEALQRLEKMGNSKIKMVLLYNLAEVYCTNNQPKLARQHCEQALQIATELGLPLAQECQKLLLKIEEAENC